MIVTFLSSSAFAVESSRGRTHLQSLSPHAKGVTPTLSGTSEHQVLDIPGPLSFEALRGSTLFLSLTEAISITKDNHAKVKRALERLLKEEALYEGKRAEFFPKIKTEVYGAFASGDETFLRYSDLAIEQPLFQGGKLRAEKNKQRVRVESKEHKLAEVKLDVELAIRVLYAQILREKELLFFSKRAIQELSEHHARIKKLVEHELISRYALQKVESLLYKGRHSLISHKEIFLYKFKALEEIVELKEGETLELELLRRVPELAPNISYYLEANREYDPDYKVRELTVKEKEFEKKALQAKRWPELNVSARGNSYRDVFVDSNRVMLGITGRWDIFDFGRIKSEIKAKSHEIEEAKWDAEISSKETEREIYFLYHSARIAEKGIWAHEALVREKKEAYKNDKARLLVGEMSQRDILDTFLSLESAKKDLIQARTEYWILLARLGHKTGFKFYTYSEEEVFIG